MFKSYFKTAWRNLWKNKAFSLINVLGLSLGMAACLLILQYVNFELSYDHFNKNAPNIYRVVNDRYQNGKLIHHGTITYSGVGKALQDVQKLNKNLSGQALAVSLLEELCRENIDKLEKILSALIDRTRFAYVPLEYYDLDRQIAPMLPAERPSEAPPREEADQSDQAKPDDAKPDKPTPTPTPCFAP